MIIKYKYEINGVAWCIFPLKFIRQPSLTPAALSTCKYTISTEHSIHRLLRSCRIFTLDDKIVTLIFRLVYFKNSKIKPYSW